MLSSLASARAGASAPRGDGPLEYGGGISNGSSTVGVMTGAEKVYLVFWGSQWGTQGSSGPYATFSGDPDGIAPYLQAFFAGLGSDGETWSQVMTEYCNAASLGSTTCTAGDAHVPYPTGGALGGVWEDTAAAAPASATEIQLGTEAVNAATHFGHTTQASNLNALYFVISPTGTDPDNYKGTSGTTYCAWHDFTGDPTLSGTGSIPGTDGILAFTNLPYLPDVGSDCGAGYVNGASGALDGLSLVGGHEYAETLTDEYPPGGWTTAGGEEDADLCAWINPGSPGGAKDITLSTGSFAVQATWSNEANHGAGTCTVAAPSNTQLSHSANTVAFGLEQAELFTATVTPSTPSKPTGTVQLSSGPPLCHMTLAAGTGSCRPSPQELRAGVHRVTGTYSGDGTFPSSISNTVTITVAQAGSTTTLAIAPTKLAAQSTRLVTVTVTVHAQYAGVPGGTVSIRSGSKRLCTITLAAGAGSCRFAPRSLGPGSHRIAGAYLGSPDFRMSASPYRVLTIT